MLRNTIGLFLVVLFYAACSESDTNTTRLESTTFHNSIERVEVLRREIKSFSDFSDAEFNLFNVNGFGKNNARVPGASSWDYQFVVRVHTDDVAKWKVGMEPATPGTFDDQWTKVLVQHRKQNWTVSSEPEYFVRTGENVMMIVYAQDGIIFKRAIQQ